VDFARSPALRRLELSDGTSLHFLQLKSLLESLLEFKMMSDQQLLKFKDFAPKVSSLELNCYNCIMWPRLAVSVLSGFPRSLETLELSSMLQSRMSLESYPNKQEEHALEFVKALPRSLTMMGTKLRTTCGSCHPTYPLVRCRLLNEDLFEKLPPSVQELNGCATRRSNFATFLRNRIKKRLQA